MNNKHSSKIAIYQYAFDCLPDIKLPQLTPKDGDQNGYDVSLGLFELSASLGNFNYNGPNTIKFLAESIKHQHVPSELVLLNNFHQVFKHHKNDPDKDTSILNKVWGHLFMLLYNELIDSDPEDKHRLQFMEFFYELIDSDRQKNSKDQIELINRLLVQVDNFMQRLQERSPDILDSRIRDTYWASNNQMLHAVKQNLSLQLGGLSFKEGITVVHNRRLTIASELRPEENNFKLINRFSDKLTITQGSYLGSAISPKEKEPLSRSSADISEDEATSPKDIFGDFLESNFICDFKESIHDLNIESPFEDSSSNGFDKDFLVSSVLNICKRSSRESELSETPKPLKMVFSHMLGALATSSEDDAPSLLHFRQKDSKKSLNNIEINYKNEVFRDFESGSEENFKINQPQLPQLLDNESLLISSSQENEIKESSKIIEEAKDNHKNESPKQSGLVKENFMSEESEWNLSSVQTPIIGLEEYINFEIPHSELYEKNSSRSSSSNGNKSPKIGCEKYLIEERNDDEEPVSLILGKISQTLSNSRLNVLKEVDKSLTELRRKNLLPGSNIEEESGSLQVAEQKNDSPITETYKNLKPFETANRPTILYRPKNESCSKHSPREILNNIKQTASDIKINILKTMDKSLLALKSSGEISEKIPELCDKNSPSPPWVKISRNKVSAEISLSKTTVDVSEDNCAKYDKDEQIDDCNQMKKLTTAPENKTGLFSETSENEIVLDSQEIISESDRKSENFLKWQYQRHMIAAPRVIVELLKLKSTCESYRQGGNELSFFEELDQFLEVINMENCSLSAEISVATIQERLGKFLSRIKKQLPNVRTHSDLVAAVGKYHVKNLLTRQERFSYEAVRLQLRDIDGKTKFEAALYGMLGYESPHLKATDGRLQMRLPHHQESIGESYLMVAFGHLGYLYRSLQEHLERLGRQGDIANAVRKCLQKELLSFYDLYNLRKNQPCSLLQLYRETRVFQLRFQWLLHALHNFNDEKSIIVCLIEELDNRVGAQRLLIQNWLNSASKPLVAKLCRWLISDHLTPLDRHELPIERCISSTNNDFWQNRYMLTDTFSSVFDSKLLEMILSIGKTQVYSQKYLGLRVEITGNLKYLNYKMRDAFTQFYEDKDQEPLYKLLCKLHLKVSGRVLAYFYEKKIEPENFFKNLHHYVILADRRFCRELIDILEPVLEEPAHMYNAKLLNQMIEQMLSKLLPDLYVAEATGAGSKCWSRFLLRWQFPHYWIALLGKEAQEYDTIFMGLWKFHYTNYVLRERIARQHYHFSKRLELKSFDGLAEVDLAFANLIKYIAGVMKVLRSYFLHEVLEQAYVKLLNNCKGAKTLDDILKANQVYLQDIKDGSFQTQISHKAIHHLGRIFSFIIDLESQQQKFFRLSQILLDSVKEYSEKNKPKSNKSYKNRMQEFYWSCQNTCESLNALEQRFHLAMIEFLISLHQANRQSFRLLAKKLDSVGDYERRDERLWLIQRFAYKRKAKMLESDGYTLQ